MRSRSSCVGRPRANVDQAAVEREVQHALHARLAVRTAHIAFDALGLRRGAGRIDAEALAEHVEVLPTGAPRHLGHAGCAPVARVDEVVEELGLDIERGVDAEGVDTDRADPVAEAVAQRAAHPRVAGGQVVQMAHLVLALLLRVLDVGERRRPVVDAGTPVGGAARVVQAEGPLRRRGVGRDAGLGV
jgi:hypothetical protein